MSNLQSLRYSNTDGEGPKLSVLDQLLIPGKKQYVDIPDVETSWSVIRSMQIRGAPLIAVVACLGLAVDLTNNEKTKAEVGALAGENGGSALLEYIGKKLDYLRSSRPTAVNLFNALDELTAVMKKAAEGASKEAVKEAIVQSVVSHAEFMLKRDVSDNHGIGAHGADRILTHAPDGVRLMTICNTGSLATAGFGTALGVARELQQRSKLLSVTALETRPYNQGSRLTAFEIMEEKMPGGLLICDSASAAFMKIKGADAVVVGADRVSANGDTANKIGTYQLSIVAKEHGVPFYVAAPCTTLDVKLASGDDITIEERPAKELIETSMAPADMDCWNPGFDVTPAANIAGIITEKGVIENSGGVIDVAGFVKKLTATSEVDTNGTHAPKLKTPAGYTEQTVDSMPTFLAKNSPAAMEALGATSAEELKCVEMGDGNLNLVFIVTNTKNNKQVIVKQALPYVRCVGESWPLTLERSYYEYRALTAENEACPEFVPSIYYFSRANGLIVMEYLPPPNIILRKGLIQGIRYPTMASDMGTFCAKTLFQTSGLKLKAKELRQSVEFWTTNTEMCALTEQVIFTEPYITAPNNRWTTPQLDSYKKAIEEDVELKLAASEWKEKFVTETQALIHGDLHSGSVMCSPAPGKTFVIDPEFAFYGPMGFDTGAFIANLFLAYVSQAGHSNGPEYAKWILEQIVTFWKTFSEGFLKLWNDPAEHIGDRYSRALLDSDEAIAAAQKSFMTTMLKDTLGFAGMKMLRRIVGIAHVEDLDSIENADVRAKCEAHGLDIAREFIKKAGTFETIEAAVELAKSKAPASA